MRTTIEAMVIMQNSARRTGFLGRICDDEGTNDDHGSQYGNYHGSSVRAPQQRHGDGGGEFEFNILLGLPGIPAHLVRPQKDPQ